MDNSYQPIKSEIVKEVKRLRQEALDERLAKKARTEDLMFKAADPLRAFLDMELHAENNRLRRELNMAIARNQIDRAHASAIHRDRDSLRLALDSASVELAQVTEAFNMVRRYAVDLEVSFAPRYFDRVRFQTDLGYPEPGRINDTTSLDYIDYATDEAATDISDTEFSADELDHFYPIE